MDFYTNPMKYTYVTGITKVFLMPTDSGGIPAVAVSYRVAIYIYGAYTILMILIFMIGWSLILAVLMTFLSGSDTYSKTPLLALWGSGESMNATMLLASYFKRVILLNKGGDMKWGGRKDLLWGLPFVFIALVVVLGNAAASVLVPAQLAMGNVAPVAKDVIFYPNFANNTQHNLTSSEIRRLDSLKVLPALRALAAVEVARGSARRRVYIDIDGEFSDSFHASYDYNVTGVDMGLQSDPKLRLRVKGSCHTDDTWLLNSTDQGDTYRLFGGNDTFEVKYQPGAGLPPMLNFRINTNTGGGSNVSYAMIPNTGGLYSHTPGHGAWYVTDKTGASVPAEYQVRRKRPVLSCWEAKTWHLNGREVDGSKLDTLPGLKLHKLWVGTVFSSEFRDPRLVSLGKAAGLSALKSASYAEAPKFILDAGASNIVKDLERLVSASWVSSRNVLRDTTTYEGGIMSNAAVGPKGLVEAASAKFVLPTWDVVTFSVRVLISIPVILLFLSIALLSLNWVSPSSKPGGRPSSAGE